MLSYKSSIIKIMSFFWVRHGERADCADEAESSLIKCDFDPHLTQKGVKMAEQTGKLINERIKELMKKGECIETPEIILVSSPFMRCLQTAHQIGLGIAKAKGDEVIHIETGIAEWFNKNFSPSDFANLNVFKRREIVDSLIGKREINMKGLFDGSQYTQPKHPESVGDCIGRTQSFIEFLAKGPLKEEKKPFDKIFIFVTHGLSIEALLFTLDGEDGNIVGFSSPCLFPNQSE